MKEKNMDILDSMGISRNREQFILIEGVQVAGGASLLKSAGVKNHQIWAVYKVCAAENERKSKGEAALTETERTDLLKEGLIVSRDNILRASEICNYSDEITVTLQSFLERIDEPGTGLASTSNTKIA